MTIFPGSASFSFLLFVGYRIYFKLKTYRLISYAHWTKRWIAWSQHAQLLKINKCPPLYFLHVNVCNWLYKWDWVTAQIVCKKTGSMWVKERKEREEGGREGGEQERNNGGCGSGQGLKRPAVVEGLAGEYNFSISICQRLFPCRRATKTSVQNPLFTLSQPSSVCVPPSQPDSPWATGQAAPPSPAPPRPTAQPALMVAQGAPGPASPRPPSPLPSYSMGSGYDPQ